MQLQGVFLNLLHIRLWGQAGHSNTVEHTLTIGQTGRMDNISWHHVIVIVIAIVIVMGVLAGPSNTVEHTLTVVGQTSSMGNISWHNVVDAPESTPRRQTHWSIG